MKMLLVICTLFGVAIPASADGVRRVRSPVVVRPAFHGHNFAFRQQQFNHGVQQFRNYGFQQLRFARQYLPQIQYQVQAECQPQIQYATVPCPQQPVFRIQQSYAAPFVQNYGYGVPFRQRAFIGGSYGGLNLNVGRLRLRF